jgi:antitoxin component of RelBE/YafQ-DinJ toxin-antitoxin module
MMLHQIVLRQGLPFEARIPNRVTISAMEELDAGKGKRSTDSTGDVFEKAVRKRSPRRA